MAIKIKDGDGNFVYMEADGAGTLADPYIGKSKLESTGPQKRLISRFLDTVGDGTGTEEHNIDGSITPVTFRIAPAPGEVFRIARLILSIRDAGTMDSGGWGNNGGVPLVNGCSFGMTMNSVVHDLGAPLLSHFDIASRSYDLSHFNFGAGDEFIVSRWTFTKFGQFLRLDGDLNDDFFFTINDNLTHLVSQKIIAQGYVE